MTCADCGQPCEGRRCQMCQRADRAAEEYAAETDGGAATVEAEPTSSDGREFDQIRFGKLHRHDRARDIRAETVEDIQERIDTSNYNPAKPLRVFEGPDGYVIADGNHRYKALEDLGVSDAFTVPCVIEADYDPDYAQIVSVATKSNRDEDVLAEDDLFDDLDRIGYLREVGHTQAEIADSLGWSESKVKQYSALLSQIVTDVLDLARTHQNGRVTSEVTSVTFTEGWFRTSGLYDLNRGGVDSWDGTHAQMRVMRWFVDDENCDASKKRVAEKCDKLLEVCEQLETLEKNLNAGVDDETRQRLRDEITERGFTDEMLETAIENANKSAQDRAVFGVDALTELQELEDSSVDLVVTDPPYGEDFASVRDSGNPEFADSAGETFEMLDDVFAELDRVTTANAHVYVFFSMTYYEQLVEIAESYFSVNRTPLIWAKNNHAPSAPGANGFEKGYAQKYEPILFCRGPNGDSRPLRPESGGVCPNVLNHARPSGQERRHDTQKPQSLLRELITNSSAVGETVLDPFAGSGSTLLAAANADRHYVGFELDGEYESGFQREMRQIKGGDAL